MTRRTESGWKAFEDEIRDVSPTELAEHLNEGGMSVVDAADVSNWKRGRTRPAFDQLPRISLFLTTRHHERPTSDPTWLAQEMGMVPKAAAAAERIIKLQTRIGAMEESLVKLDKHAAARRNASAGSIVAAAAQTGRWAAAVWPALEGPEGYRFHVADRIDLTRVDGGEVTVDAVRQEVGADGGSALPQVLDSAHAVLAPRAQPRWSGLLKDDHAPTVVSYSIPRLSGMFPPGTTSLVDSHGAIAVVSLSLATWSMDVAGFLARMLNYGLLTARGISTETFGSRGVAGTPREEEIVRRRDLHLAWIEHPESRHVWGHFDSAATPENLFPDTKSPWPERLTFVWVRETDNLLKTLPDGGEKVARARAACDQYVKQPGQNRVITVDADYPDEAELKSMDEAAIRDWKMGQALAVAADVLEQMVRRHYINESEAAKSLAKLSGDDRSTIAHTMAAWINEKRPALLGDLKRLERA